MSDECRSTTTAKIDTDTHRRMKIISAATGKPIIRLLDGAILPALERLEEEHLASRYGSRDRETRGRPAE
jgi:hypothetical protein